MTINERFINQINFQKNMNRGINLELAVVERESGVFVVVDDRKPTTNVRHSMLAIERYVGEDLGPSSSLYRRKAEDLIRKAPSGTTLSGLRAILEAAGFQVGIYPREYSPNRAMSSYEILRELDS